MFRLLNAESSVLPGDLESFKRQRVVFSIVNLLLLLVLLFLHTWFASFWGKPSTSLSVLLAASFVVRTLELLWLRGRELNAEASRFLTAGSMALNLGLAVALATVVDREDSQYFALLVVPILESAFRFSLRLTLAVVTAADSIAFYWVWRYFHAHPPLEVGEYFEAGTVSLIFLIVGVLISMMVESLGRKQALLAQVRERLLQDEKLAAVGRISSVMAHEIRNPVAMISSSLSTAKMLSGENREEMLEIAALEASRLVKLTSALLAYARPRQPAPARNVLSDTVNYVKHACLAHAGEKSITLTVLGQNDVVAEYDEAMVREALMNLVMNAVDASPAGEAVSLRVAESGADEARIDVENGGNPIPPKVVQHLFEPFFTTKASGSGMGLATARSTLRAQGGDLVLAGNARRVCFSMILPKRSNQLHGGAGN